MNDTDQARTTTTQQLGRYFRSLGIVDAPTVQRLTDRVLDECNAHDASSNPGLAIGRAQAMVQKFLDQLDSDRATASRHWLPVFLRAHAESFPDDPAAARRFVDAAAHRDASVYHGFHSQDLHPQPLPRWLGLVLPSITIGAAVALYAVDNVGPDLAPLMVGSWALLIGVLTALVMMGLISSVVGFLAGGAAPAAATADRSLSPLPLPPTAIVMPIYHEDAERVIAGLVAMWEGLRHLPGGSAFEFFVLSDSTDAEFIRRENHAVAWLRQRGASEMPFHYRRRTGNGHKKAGNLAEFFSTVGHRFTYALLLDADSVMRPETVIEMTRRMEGNPRIGLLQAPLQLINARTFFARAQQFTSAVVGPMATRGLAIWTQEVGNYYGHNAVVRVSAFLESCALPVLQGRPPLGGQLLSHDFVEAAMLCRAGWEVRIAHDLRGSWEEVPPTLTEFAARDRRWCQGNLQHLRILRAGGFRMASRLHLLLGAASYLASPALVIFLILGFAMAAADSTGGASTVGLTLTLAAVGGLVATRILAWIDVIRSGSARTDFGGVGRFTVSALIDGLTAATLGPLLMVHHTVAVLSILLGRSSGWGAQRRTNGPRVLLPVVRTEMLSTVLGLVIAGFLAGAAPGLLWWTAPLWLPLILAIPLSLITSSTRVGTALSRADLLTVPTERRSEPVWKQAERLAAQLPGQIRSHELRDVVLDAILLAEHCRTLGSTQHAAGDGRVRDLLERAAEFGPAGLSAAERRILLADKYSLGWLHEKAWLVWDSTPPDIDVATAVEISPVHLSPAVIAVETRNPLRLAIPSV